MRVLGIPALLVALVVGVYVASKQVRSHSPQPNMVPQNESQAEGAAAATNFASAATALQAYFAANGTYIGATLPASSGVQLVGAGGNSYCLQAPDSSEHLAGPNGQPAAGPC
jgi:hypothetical protein